MHSEKKSCEFIMLITGTRSLNKNKKKKKYRKSAKINRGCSVMGKQLNLVCLSALDFNSDSDSNLVVENL